MYNPENSEPILRKTWEVSAFDREKGEWTTTQNRAYEHSTPIEDLIIRPASERTYDPIAPKRRRTRETLSVIGGDAQFPFGDDKAVDSFLKLVDIAKPDEVLLTGDMTDFPALSKFQQRREWVGSTQTSIDQYYSFLARLRETAPDARIAAVHGNHEQRLINALERHLSEVAGLRRAMGNKALLSVQHLCRYDELGVESVDGWPNGILWLEDNLKVTHGTNTRKGGSNAAKYLASENESTIYGHSHRMEVAFRTRATRFGSRVIAAASPGCLAAVNGTVPGYYYSPMAEGGEAKRAEDWQQGALILTRKKETHNIEPIRFTEEGFRFNGKHYE